MVGFAHHFFISKILETMTPLEKKIQDLLTPTVNYLGYNIVLVKVGGARTQTLEVLIESQDENQGVTVAACREVSKNVSAILDVEDIIKDKYFLEVSSAGVERPLTLPQDYNRFKGRQAELKLTDAMQERKKLTGTILGISENELIKFKDNTIGEIEIEFDKVRAGKLVLTDEMFREILKKGN